MGYINSDYDIEIGEGGGVAVAPGRVVRVAGIGGRIFKRRAIQKNLKEGTTQEIMWLVAELNGVRLYIDGDTLVMTTEDINP